MNQDKNTSKSYKKLNLFFYKYEYSILELAGVFSGLLIISLANNFFVTSKMYFLIFIFGFIVCSLGFLIEYLIKHDKRKTIENEFSYFLKDLSREYKSTPNVALALANLSESNFYGSINVEIKRISNRVSWGEDFEEALKSINNTIQSNVIEHSLILLNTLKNSKIPYYRVLENISKDLNIFTVEKTNLKYFSNLFNLSIVFYFIFIFVILYIDQVIGQNFLWFSSVHTMTRVFFDNFLLYISLLLAFFTAYVMYVINKNKTIVLLKYITIFFIITIVLFQIVIPKPDANEVLIDTIDYLDNSNIVDTNSLYLENIITLKSISARQIEASSLAEQVYFIHFKDIDCGINCSLSTIIIDEPRFYNFDVFKLESSYIIYYEEVD